MEVFSSVTSAAGPWIIALGMVVTMFTLISRGKLIPGKLHEERMHDKDTIIDILQGSNDRVLAVAETREVAMNTLMHQLTEAAEKFNRIAS